MDTQARLSRPQEAAGSPGEPRRIPLRGLRGAIARNMAAGWQAPRVAMSVEASIAQCEARRLALQARLGEGVKLTLTAFVLRALALTLREHPRMNAWLREDAIEVPDEVNLALAVSLPEGLMAPVIRDADRKTVEQIALESRELAEQARANRLPASALQRGTFTLSNLGMTAIDHFTPILNPPQVGILGVTRAVRKPVVRGSVVEIVPRVGLHLVFDHRAVDGHPAALFLGSLVRRIESAEDL